MAGDMDGVNFFETNLIFVNWWKNPGIVLANPVPDANARLQRNTDGEGAKAEPSAQESC